MAIANPPLVNSNDKVILFDGVCKLCSSWSRFIIRHDHQRKFKLASVQSPEGQAILAFFALPTDSFDSMLYLEGPEKFAKSSAILKIAAQLGLPWRALVIARLIPLTIRDWCYDWIARNRYSLFGRYHSYDECLLPAADHDARFLRGEKITHDLPGKK